MSKRVCLTLALGVLVGVCGACAVSDRDAGSSPEGAEGQRASERAGADRTPGEAERPGDDADPPEARGGAPPDPWSPEALARGYREVGASPTPLADGVDLSPSITHPFLPLRTLELITLRDPDWTVTTVIRPRTETVAGVECLVQQTEAHRDGRLQRAVRRYFAQDARGNVYLLAKEVDEYDGFDVTGHAGTWRVGEQVEEPSLYMPAELRTGFRFKREDAPPVAEQFNEITSTDTRVSVPVVRKDRIIAVAAGDAPGQWSDTFYYSQGVGLLSISRELKLVRVRRREAGGG